MEKRIHLLDHMQIMHKLKRIAFQLYENNLNEKAIYIGGIGERGAFIAEKIASELRHLEALTVHYFQITTQHTAREIELSVDKMVLQNQTIVLVDDVLNTGKTLIEIMMPLFACQPLRIETCFLAQRNHRMFPVTGDYVGLKLATTFQEHIFFDCSNPNDLKLYIE